MRMPTYDSVDAYLDAQAELPRRLLRRVRAVVKKSAPGLDESMSYKIPTYKLGGKPVVFFAAWKTHWSLYPASAAVFQAIPELVPHKHAKDTVRFAYDERLPVHLVSQMVKVRAAEVAASMAEPAPRKPKRAAKAPTRLEARARGRR